MAQAVNNKQYVFQSLSDPILDNLFDSEEDNFFSWNSILTFTDTGVTVLLAVGLFYTVYRLNKLSAMYLA